MSTSSHPDSSSTSFMTVLNPTPISFAPPATEAVPGTAKPMPSVPVFNIKKSKSKGKKPKLNEDPDTVSTELKDSATPGPADSRKGKKLRADRDSSPAVSLRSKRPDWLPEDWIVEERVRIGGSTAGSKDKYYINPANGKRLRSLVEVRRELNLGASPVPSREIDSGKCKSTEAGPSNEVSNKEKAQEKPGEV